MTKSLYMKVSPNWQICAVACLCFLAQLRGRETAISYVDIQMSVKCTLEDIAAMKVLNPLLY